MPIPTTAPYGSWKSPITSDVITARSIGVGRVLLDGDDVYWLEMRPAEGGRYVIVRRAPDGATADVTPPPYSARTRVHEYGGGAALVHQGTLYISNFADQRLYQFKPGGAPEPLTPAVDLRYADGVIDARRNRLICVREDHTDAGREAVNTLVAVDLAGGDLARGGAVLASGHDFYAAPRLSPDGARLAWLAWNHPNMPWDGTELWMAEVAADGALLNPHHLAGGPTESLFQPEWAPDGALYFVSDRTGWWNLYRWRGGVAEPLCPMEAEFGDAQWGLGLSLYSFESAGRLICTYYRDGRSHLAALDTHSLALTPIETPYTEIGSVRAAPGRVCFAAGSPPELTAIVQVDLATGAHTVLRRSADVALDACYLSAPQPIEFPTEGGLTAHAIYYPPRNCEFTAPPGDRPPLLVMSHGGPTAATSTSLNLEIQYWTSRGIAVVDVNYGGSTGYGRAYRERLRGQWGVVDVDDCVNAARYLAARGEVDGARLAITGGSAGGYTTLCALTFRQIFRAGASHFGIGDLTTFTSDTHKFESRYLDGLVGPYPQAAELYRARSPIHFVDQLDCPLILFQGSEDKIVPPAQSRQMFEAVRAKGLPVAYLEFAGEQHGFRKAENIKRALDGELVFYARVFGFELADPVEPVEIENL